MTIFACGLLTFFGIGQAIFIFAAAAEVVAAVTSMVAAAKCRRGRIWLAFIAVGIMTMGAFSICGLCGIGTPVLFLGGVVLAVLIRQRLLPV